MKTWGVFVTACVCLMVCLTSMQQAAAQAKAEAKAEAKADTKAAAKQAPDEGAISDAELRDLVETVLTARLAKELKLNDEQTVVLVRRLSEYKDKVGALRRERQEAAKALKKGFRDNESDANIQKLLDTLVAKDTEIFESRKSLYEKVGEGLSTAQRARLYVFLTDFEADMRQLIQKAREKAFRRGFLGMPDDKADVPHRRPIQEGVSPANGGRGGKGKAPAESEKR